MTTDMPISDAELAAICSALDGLPETSDRPYRGMIARIRALEAEVEDQRNGLKECARIRKELTALKAAVARKDAALRSMIAAHTWHENAPTPYVTWEGLEAERASKAAALVQARAAVEGRS